MPTRSKGTGRKTKRGNNKARGTAYEHRSQRLLEAKGYTVVRSAASGSPIDLVAMTEGRVRLIQVKRCTTRASVYTAISKTKKSFRESPLFSTPVIVTYDFWSQWTGAPPPPPDWAEVTTELWIWGGLAKAVLEQHEWRDDGDGPTLCPTRWPNEFFNTVHEGLL